MPHLFEWDSAKAAGNLRKHGVSFDEAIEAFGDPLALNMPDLSHAPRAERFLILGLPLPRPGHLAINERLRALRRVAP